MKFVIFLSTEKLKRISWTLIDNFRLYNKYSCQFCDTFYKQSLNAFNINFTLSLFIVISSFNNNCHETLSITTRKVSISFAGKSKVIPNYLHSPSQSSPNNTNTLILLPSSRMKGEWKQRRKRGEKKSVFLDRNHYHFIITNVIKKF